MKGNLDVIVLVLLLDNAEVFLVFKYMAFVKMWLSCSCNAISHQRVLVKEIHLCFRHSYHFSCSLFSSPFGPRSFSKQTVVYDSEYSGFGRRPQIFFVYEIRKANNNNNNKKCVSFSSCYKTRKSVTP